MAPDLPAGLLVKQRLRRTSHGPGSPLGAVPDRTPAAGTHPWHPVLYSRPGGCEGLRRPAAATVQAWPPFHF